MALIFFLLFVGQVVMATNEIPLWKETIKENIYGPTANQVWPLFEDYCNYYKIYPFDVSFCVDGSSSHIGLHRYLATKDTSSDGNITHIRWETNNLTTINPTKRYLTYELIESNSPLTKFEATMSVLPKKYGSQIVWAYIMSPTKEYTSQYTSTTFRALILQPQWHQTAKRIERLLQGA